MCHISSFKGHQKNEKEILNYSFLYEIHSIYKALSPIVPTFTDVMSPRVLYNGCVHNEHTIGIITHVI